MEAVSYFSDRDRSLILLSKLRWPDGIECPTCSSKKVSFLSTRRLWKCSQKHDRRQFSIKVGSIFEDSPLGLDKWMVAMWQIVNCKNGVSSYEVGRALNVTQPTAWFMLHRIRKAMQRGSFEKFGADGPVEADETFIGGLARNTHKDKRVKITGTGGAGKELVMACWIARLARFASSTSPTASAVRFKKRCGRMLYWTPKFSPTNWRPIPASMPITFTNS